MLRVRAAALLTLALLAGCGDGSTGPETPKAGTLVFAYEGGGYAGRMSASGTLRLDAAGRPEFGTYAAGARGPSRGQDALAVVAFEAREQAQGDRATFSIWPFRGTGDYDLANLCDPQAGMRCASGSFVINPRVVWTGQPSETRAIFLFRSGTLTITRVDDRSVAGTFSGTGRFIVGSSGSDVVEVTDGRFEVPLVQGSERDALLVTD